MNNAPVQPQITEYLYQKAAKAGVALSGTFELTPLCNMDCKMCYIKLTKEQQEKEAGLKSAEEWLRLAKEAKEQGMVYLLLTGGEPFLHPQFRQILEGLHSMGFVISINTNGTLIDEETVEWLKKCPPSRVNITVYGKDNGTYSRLCGKNDGFDKMEKAVKMLKEIGITVKLNCSVTPSNADDLPEIIDFAKKNKCIIQVATYMFPPTRRCGEHVAEDYRLSPEDAAYYEILSDYLILGKERFLEYGGRIPEYRAADDDCVGVGDGVRCRAGKCSFWVNWKGEMLPCGMFDSSFGVNVFENGFENAWAETKDRVEKIILPKKCSGCKIKDNCRACAAMVITESGNFDDHPVYRCKMMESYKKQYERVKRGIL